MIANDKLENPVSKETNKAVSQTLPPAVSAPPGRVQLGEERLLRGSRGKSNAVSDGDLASLWGGGCMQVS